MKESPLFYRKKEMGILANPIVLAGGGTLHAHQLERRPSKGNMVDLIGAGQPTHLETPASWFVLHRPP